MDHVLISARNRRMVHRSRAFPSTSWVGQAVSLPPERPDRPSTWSPGFRTEAANRSPRWNDEQLEPGRPQRTTEGLSRSPRRRRRWAPLVGIGRSRRKDGQRESVADAQRSTTSSTTPTGRAFCACVGFCWRIRMRQTM